MIRLEKIQCGYGPKIVLDGIDLEIKKGEFVGIIGPNGSGKTTVLRAITRLIKPTRGKIYLDDRDIYSLNHQRNRATDCRCLSEFTRYHHDSKRICPSRKNPLL